MRYRYAIGAMLALAGAASAGERPKPLPFPGAAVGAAYAPNAGSTLPTAGDVTGDGLPDLIDAPVGGDRIAIRASAGRWRWETPVVAATLSPQYALRGLLATDFDGDGITDLVYWGGYELAKAVRIGVLLGDGAGGFTHAGAATRSADLVDDDRPDTIAVGDVDGDGLPDIAVATGAELLIALGTGGGGLEPIISAPVPAPMSIEVTDLDGDGAAEILTGAGAPPEVIVTSMTGDAPAVVDSIDPEIFFFFADLANLDAAMFGEPPSPHLFVGGSNNQFGEEPVRAIAIAPDGSLSLGPISTEGFGGDILYTDALGGPGLDVISAEGKALIDVDANLAGEVVDLPYAEALALADADLDGDIDLFFGDASGVQPTEVTGPAHAREAIGVEQATVPIDSIPDILCVATADFNADGRDEIAVGDTRGGIVLMELSPDGTLSGKLIDPNPSVARLYAADLDGDGNHDLYTPVFGNPAVYYGDGAGGFTRDDFTPPGFQARDTAHGDFDGDGTIDLVASGLERVTLYAQTAPGVFTPGPVVEIDEARLGIAAVNLNGDSADELVIGTDDGFAVLTADGVGGVTESARYHAGIAAESIALTDLDGDGDPDLALAGWADTLRVAVYENAGDGAFVQRQPIDLGGGDNVAGGEQAVPGQFVIADDFDGDGNEDLAVLDNLSRVHILYGDSAWGFDAGHSLAPQSGYVNQLAAGDLDGNGTPDLAYGVGSGGGFSGGTLGAVAWLNRLGPADMCPADLAAPYGTLDLADITAFIGGFTGQDVASDPAAPYGVFDLADLVFFITQFEKGCQ